MELEVSLPCSQELATGIYPVPDESCWHCCFKIHLDIPIYD